MNDEQVSADAIINDLLEQVKQQALQIAMLRSALTERIKKDEANAVQTLE